MGTSYWVPVTKKRKPTKAERQAYRDGFIAGVALAKGIEDWPLVYRNDDVPAYVWFKEGEKEFHALGDKKACQEFIDLYENCITKPLPHWK